MVPWENDKAEDPLQPLQSREHKVPEIACAGTQIRIHEEKTLRRFHIMRNQVGMDTGELAEPKAVLTSCSDGCPAPKNQSPGGT